MEQLLSVSQNTNGLWPPRPTTAICPRCTTIVITTIEVRQSVITHVAAFTFFLCGCWPCCMLPYCMNSCKNISHYCPICRAYLGTYRPW
ncbi:lipopolysaccharide-induced tumor necrosis factor-alpha factor homolog [Colletes latitarsis]|uniref:lipopolysaccharide-induced tumor necrosis factor-alpha factor homolog n=1 Tax=Colletes latitarsis TaxID=2605962 RepID=UPI0040359D9C